MNRREFTPGPPAAVECHADGDRWRLVFIREFRHTPEEIWPALTDPAQLREWSPFVADVDLGREGDATLTMIDGDEREDLPARVLRAVAPNLLEYTWGGDVLRWELERRGSGTRLTLHHTIDNRDWVPMAAAGWHICLAVADYLLNGNPVGPIVGAEAKNYGWDALNDAYSETLGIASAGWPDPTP